MIRFAGVLVFSISLFAPDAQSDWVTPSERVRDGISIRQGPSSSSAYLGQLDIGERLEYLSSVLYWYEVRLANGQSAFVSKAWSTIVPDAEAPNRSPRTISGRLDCPVPEIATASCGIE